MYAVELAMKQTSSVVNMETIRFVPVVALKLVCVI